MSFDHPNPAIAYSDGSSTSWQWNDTNGASLNQFTPQNVWSPRCTDLSESGARTGETIQWMGVLTDVTTGAGTWDIYYSDMSITSANGTVTKINLDSATYADFQDFGSGWQGTPTASPETVSAALDPTLGAQGAATHFYTGDHLGTAQLELASGGWPVYQGQFAPYGQELQPNGSLLATDAPDGSSNHYKFTGQERDTESGNDYFGARYYGSGMGRFMSPDAPWIDQSPEDPQSWNMYGYVRNNPLSNVDPDGNDCVVQSRTSNTTETVSTTSGNCDNVQVGDGQTKTYVAGTVTGISVNGGNSIDISYNSYDGQSSGVTNAASAPIPDNPGLAYNWGNNAQGYQTLSSASTVVKGATVAVAGVYGSLLLGGYAAGVIGGPGGLTMMESLAQGGSFAGKIIGWGTGQAGVAVTLARLASLTPDDVKEMVAQGLQLGTVQKLLNTYQVAMAGSAAMQANTQLAARAQLMQKIVEFWPSK